MAFLVGTAVGSHGDTIVWETTAFNKNKLNTHKNKSNNGYIEKEEIDNKINNNLHNVNEKEIRNQKKERNHKIKNNVKNEKNKSIEILIQPYKDKGYMTQTDFRKIINEYENKLINSNKINKNSFQLDKE